MASFSQKLPTQIESIPQLILSINVINISPSKCIKITVGSNYSQSKQFNKDLLSHIWAYLKGEKKIRHRECYPDLRVKSFHSLWLVTYVQNFQIIVFHTLWNYTLKQIFFISHQSYPHCKVTGPIGPNPPKHPSICTVPATCCTLNWYYT